jgi:hypothetical protein
MAPVFRTSTQHVWPACWHPNVLESLALDEHPSRTAPGLRYRILKPTSDKSNPDQQPAEQQG